MPRSYKGSWEERISQVLKKYDAITINRLSKESGVSYTYCYYYIHFLIVYKRICLLKVEHYIPEMQSTLLCKYVCVPEKIDKVVREFMKRKNTKICQILPEEFHIKYLKASKLKPNHAYNTSTIDDKTQRDRTDDSSTRQRVEPSSEQIEPKSTKEP